MAVRYFRDMPTTDYDINGNGETKTVVDIMRRVRLRSDLEQYVQSYYSQSLNSAMRPEMIANEEFDSPQAHWILMMLNGVQDPFYDWYIDPRTLDKIIDKKYPNKVIQLPSDYYTTEILQAKLFHVGEELKDNQAPGLSAGNVVGFNADLRQIVVTTIPNWTEDSSIIVGQESNAIFTWSTAVNNATVNQRDAIRHYEKPTTDGDGRTVGSGIVVGSSYSGAVSITNAEYEIAENEKKREIKILNKGYVPVVEEEYTKKITK